MAHRASPLGAEDKHGKDLGLLELSYATVQVKTTALNRPALLAAMAHYLAPREVAAQRTDRNGIWMDGCESYQNNRR